MGSCDSDNDNDDAADDDDDNDSAMTMNDNNIDNDNAIPLGWYLSDARFGFFYTSRGCCAFQRTTTRTISFHWLLCRRPG